MPEPALTSKDLGVLELSLLMVPVKVISPPLEVIDTSPVNLTAPFKLILPAAPVPVLVRLELRLIMPP